MNRKFRKYGLLSFFSLLAALLLLVITAAPSQAHWADLAAAEIVIGKTDAEMTLTFPTGLVAFADSDRNGQLAANEIQAHTAQLQDFLAKQIRFSNSEDQSGTLTVSPLDSKNLPPTVRVAPNTHSTLLLTYTWQKPIQGIKIHYNLFLPGVSTASCLVTVLQDQQLKTFVFTPKKQYFALTPGLAGFESGGLLLAIAGAFVWGAVHSLTPGHGKTIVGAYLVGTRATPKHALFLALTTTTTHTIGVFALGFVTLFAAQYILPEQLYPWLNLLSGLMVASIGFNLFRRRFRNSRSSAKRSLPDSHHHSAKKSHSHLHQVSPVHSHPDEFNDRFHIHSHPDHNLIHIHGREHDHEHSHSHDHVHASTPSHRNVSSDIDHHVYEHRANRFDSGEHSHSHSHHHSHGHTHTHHEHHGQDEHHHSHDHSHLPPGADGSPITWRSLLAMGISGGIVPCPAALVLLLSCIALGNVGLGLFLVLAFSLGLAGVLIGLGLSLIYAKQLFHRLPTHLRFIKMLPVISAIGITLLGFGISTNAVMQMLWR